MLSNSACIITLIAVLILIAPTVPDLECVDGLARFDIVIDETVGGQLPRVFGEFGIGALVVNAEFGQRDCDGRLRESEFR
ncbi:hypothetical protein ACFQGT_00900 [Natrialbaceae archaeon GCM10025810]|uniref:hypothetical protein n=1 Tax=Halovalidus salilacus TaxID=3075124 RepID=UPI003622661B